MYKTRSLLRQIELTLVSLKFSPKHSLKEIEAPNSIHSPARIPDSRCWTKLQDLQILNKKKQLVKRVN